MTARIVQAQFLMCASMKVLYDMLFEIMNITTKQLVFVNQINSLK